MQTPDGTPQCRTSGGRFEFGECSPRSVLNKDHLRTNIPSGAKVRVDFAALTASGLNPRPTSRALSKRKCLSVVCIQDAGNIPWTRALLTKDRQASADCTARFLARRHINSVCSTIYP